MQYKHFERAKIYFIFFFYFHSKKNLKKINSLKIRHSQSVFGRILYLKIEKFQPSTIWTILQNSPCLYLQGIKRKIIALDKSNKETIELLKSKIDRGIYSLGQLIVPQKFKKTLRTNGKVITEEISILGKKFTLKKIRKDLLINHKQQMRLASDQVFSKFTKEEVIEKLLDTGELNESEELLSFKKLS